VVQQELGSVAASVHKSQSSNASDQFRASLAYIAEKQQKMDEALKLIPTTGDVVDTWVRSECCALRALVDDIRSELQKLSAERVPSHESVNDGDFSRLSQTVRELVGQARSKNNENKRTTAQFSDMTERMIQNAVIDLRTEFMCMQREKSSPQITTQHDDITRECNDLRNQVDELMQLYSVLKDDMVRDSERAELQRRQLAKIVSELDHVKKMIRSNT
jgi:hypothetical protein